MKAPIGTQAKVLSASVLGQLAQSRGSAPPPGPLPFGLMEAAESQTLRITLLGEEYDVPVKELASEASPHSGRQLRRVNIALSVSAEKSEDVSRELLAAREPEQAITGDGTRWRVMDSSYSYQEGAAVHRHRAELREVEEPPKAERVEMLGLSLRPRKYMEEVDEEDGTLLISILVLVEGAEDDALEAAIRDQRAERGYFPIIRVGVSDTPLEARFGRCLWKKEDSGRLHLLRLVGDSEVEREESAMLRIHQPELRLAQQKAAALEDMLATLVAQLGEAGVLSEEQGRAIRESANGSWRRHSRDFDEAVNIESYFKG